jgi:hypothetical protein
MPAVTKPVVAKPAAKKAVARKVAVKKAVATKAASAKPAVKPAAKAAPSPASVDKKAAKPPKADKAEKAKQKLVRDSFTMPQADWALIAQLKERALGFKRPAKKSELLRAGLQALAALPDAKLQAALNALQPLKLGRPKSEADPKGKA